MRSTASLFRQLGHCVLATVILLLLTQSSIGQGLKGGQGLYRGDSRETTSPRSEDDHRLWTFAIMAGGNVGMPGFPVTSDYYRGTTAGFGLDLDVLVHLVGKFSLRGTISRAGLGVDSDPTIISSDGYTDYIYRHFDVTATRFFVSAQFSAAFFFESLRERSLGKTILSANLGAGVIRHEFSVSEITYPVPAETGLAIPVSDAQWKPAITLGVNYTQMFGRTVGAFVGSDGDFVLLGNQSDDIVHWRENSNLAFMMYLKLGLIIRLK